MKKSLIALAVAGVVSAPAFAATSNVDIYGQLMFSVDRVTADTAAVGDDEADWVTGRDNASRIGFKGSEDLGGGLKALWQIEQQLSITAGGAGTAAPGDLRNTFVGLNGGFGTVVLGRHDTPYKLATGKLDPFGDTLGDYNAIIGRSSTTAQAALMDLRADNTIAYISPTMSGFHAAVAYVEVKSAEAAATDSINALSMMGMYENGPLFASLAYETHSGALGAQAAANNNDKLDSWKLGLGYTFGDTMIGFVYEDIEGGDTNGAAVGGKANERKAWYVSGTHAMGPIKIKAAYGKAGDSDANATANDGAKFFTLGADYSLSKRTTLFALYANLNNDGSVGGAVTNGQYTLLGGPAVAGADDGSSVKAWSFGVKHTF